MIDASKATAVPPRKVIAANPEKLAVAGILAIALLAAAMILTVTRLLGVWGAGLQ